METDKDKRIAELEYAIHLQNLSDDRTWRITLNNQLERIYQKLDALNENIIKLGEGESESEEKPKLPKLPPKELDDDIPKKKGRPMKPKYRDEESEDEDDESEMDDDEDSEMNDD